MDSIHRFQSSSQVNVESLWGRKRRRGRPRRLGPDGKPTGKGKSAGTALTPELTQKLGEAEAFYVDGNHSEAIRVLGEITKMAPKLSYIYSMLALIYEQAGYPQYSLQLYALAAAYDNKDTDAWAKVVHRGLELKEYDQVITALYRCVRLSERKHLGKEKKRKERERKKRLQQGRGRGRDEEFESEQEDEEEEDSEDEDERQRTAARDQALSLNAKELQALLQRNRHSSSPSVAVQSSKHEFQRFSRLRLILLIKMGRFNAYRDAIKQHRLSFPLDAHIYCEVAQCFFEQGYDRHAVDHFQKYLEHYLLHLIQNNQLVASMQTSSSSSSASSSLSMSQMMSPQALIATREAQEKLSENLLNVFFATRQLCLLLLESFRDCQEIIELIENLFTIFHQMKTCEPPIVAVQTWEFPLDLLLFLGINKLKIARIEVEINAGMKILQPALLSIMQNPQQYFSLIPNAEGAIEARAARATQQGESDAMDVDGDEGAITTMAEEDDGEEKNEEEEGKEEISIDARTLEDQLFLLYELLLVGEFSAEQGMKAKGQRLLIFSLDVFRRLIERDSIRSLFVHMLSPQCVCESVNLCEQVSYRFVQRVLEKLVDAYIMICSIPEKAQAHVKEGRVLLSLLQEATDVYPSDALLMRDLSLTVHNVCDAVDPERELLLQKLKLFTCLLKKGLKETISLRETEREKEKEAQRARRALRREAKKKKDTEGGDGEGDGEGENAEEGEGEDGDGEGDREEEIRAEHEEYVEAEADVDAEAEKIIEELDSFMDFEAAQAPLYRPLAQQSFAEATASSSIGNANEASLGVVDALAEEELEADDDDEDEEDLVAAYLQQKSEEMNLDRVLHGESAPSLNTEAALVDSVGEKNTPLALTAELQREGETERDKESEEWLEDRLQNAVFEHFHKKQYVHRNVLHYIVTSLVQYTHALFRQISLPYESLLTLRKRERTRGYADEVSTFLTLCTAWFDCFTRTPQLNLKTRERVEIALFAKHVENLTLRLNGKEIPEKQLEEAEKRHRQVLTEIVREDDEKFSWMRQSDRELFAIVLTLCEYIPVEEMINREALIQFGKRAREIFTEHSLLSAVQQLRDKESEVHAIVKAATDAFFTYHYFTPASTASTSHAVLNRSSSRALAQTQSVFMPKITPSCDALTSTDDPKIQSRRLRMLFYRQNRVIRNVEQINEQCREIAQTITNVYNDLCRVKADIRKENAPSSTLLSTSSSQAIAVQLEGEIVHYTNLFGQLLHQQYHAELLRGVVKANDTEVLRKADSRYLENRLPLKTMFDEGKLREMKIPTMELLLGHEWAIYKRHNEVLEHYLNAFALDPQQPLISLCLATYLVMLSNHHLTKHRLSAVSKGYAFFLHYKHIRCNTPTPALLPHEQSATFVTLSEAAKLQETLYNFGRAFQELDMPQLAAEQYEQALKLVDQHPELGIASDATRKLNVTRQCALNLVLLYKQTRAPQLALEIMMKYLVFE